MKDLARYIAIPRLVSLAIGIWSVIGAQALAAVPCAGAPPVALEDLSKGVTRALTFPSFCSIPSTPTDIRRPDAFKAAVLDSREAGATVVAQTAPETFGLKATSDFEARAKRAAAPPPQMTEPGDLSTDAFIKAARARATPPPRPH